MSRQWIPVAILVAVLVATGLRLSGARVPGWGADPLSQEHLSEVAAGLSEDAPIHVDSDTEMIGAEGLEGVLVYRLRLVNYSVEQLDPGQIEEAMTPQLREGACRARSATRELLDQGVTLRYSYSDKARREVTSIEVNAADCPR